jgi:hypothetical protein
MMNVNVLYTWTVYLCPPYHQEGGHEGIARADKWIKWALSNGLQVGGSSAKFLNIKHNNIMALLPPLNLTKLWPFLIVSYRLI